MLYSLSFAVCLLFYLSRRKYFANESKPFAQQMSAPFAPIRNVFTLMLCVLSMWMREREQTFVIPQFRVFKIKSLLIRHVTRSFSATPADIIYVNCCRCELVECKFFSSFCLKTPIYMYEYCKRLYVSSLLCLLCCPKTQLHFYWFVFARFLATFLNLVTKQTMLCVSRINLFDRNNSIQWQLRKKCLCRNNLQLVLWISIWWSTAFCVFFPKRWERLNFVHCARLNQKHSNHGFSKFISFFKEFDGLGKRINSICEVSWRLETKKPCLHKRSYLKLAWNGFFQLFHH